MNHIIKEQLLKCKTANIPDFDDSTTFIEIKCGTKQEGNSLQQNHYYIIKLENYIINPPENFNLASNWNKGINPVSSYLLITPKQTLGKMTKFDGCGYDIDANNALSDTYSDLWLPEKGFKVIREVK